MQIMCFIYLLDATMNNRNLRIILVKDFKEALMVYLYTPLGEWADPGGTAIPGQPVEGSEQAPETPPMCKNQFNIVETQ